MVKELLLVVLEALAAADPLAYQYVLLARLEARRVAEGGRLEVAA